MLDDSRSTAEVGLTIPFHDVDMMGVAWHGNYFHYFEATREALLSQFSYDYQQIRESGYLWPMVDARVEYCHAFTFEQHIRVCTRIEEFEGRLRIDYQIFDTETGERVTTGYIIQAAVEEQSRELYLVSPDILSERIGIKP